MKTFVKETTDTFTFNDISEFKFYTASTNKGKFVLLNTLGGMKRNYIFLGKDGCPSDYFYPTIEKAIEENIYCEFFEFDTFEEVLKWMLT